MSGTEETDDLIDTSVISTEYGVAKTVLSHLGCKDLARVASVCHLWHQISKTLLSHRSTLHWSYECQVVKGHKYSNRNYKVFELDSFVDGFSEKIESSPKFCVCFTSANALKRRDKKETFECRHSKCGNEDGAKRMSVLTSHFPSCQMLLVKAPGIIGTDSENKNSYECENDAGFTMLAIPELHNVQITPFVLNRMDINSGIMELGTQEELTKLIGLPKETNPKALLLFTSSSLYGLIGSLSEKFSSWFDPIAIGGGFIDHSLFIPLKEEATGTSVTGVVFSGDGVRAASVVIAAQDPQGVEEKILELKSAQLPEEKSVCFMFACVGRGVHMFGEEGFETRIFRKHFPKTPVFGFFGNGEIGIDCLPVVNATEKRFSFSNGEKKIKLSREFVRGYSTILVLLSFVKK